MLLTLALLGAEEWLFIIVLVAVFFFGATKIPQLARSLGRAKGEFQKGAQEGRDELARAASEKPATTADDEKVLKAARELGIPTDGRPIADVKRDVRAKLS